MFYIVILIRNLNVVKNIRNLAKRIANAVQNYNTQTYYIKI